MTVFLAPPCCMSRKVDTYILTKENMTIYQDAVRLAAANRAWLKRSNRKRKNQRQINILYL